NLLIEQVSAIAMQEHTAKASTTKLRKRDAETIECGVGLEPFARPTDRDELFTRHGDSWRLDAASHGLHQDPFQADALAEIGAFRGLRRMKPTRVAGDDQRRPRR